MIERIWIAIFLLPYLRLLEAHVSLTYPPARFPPLDFLDNARTQTPCGVPRPRGAVYSELSVGTPINVTWRMQYPHQGGYRIRLLDPSFREVEVLTDKDKFSGLDDQTVENAVVRFSMSCLQCTLVLERQAAEWGQTYIFHSCADVNVRETTPDDKKCSGHGSFENAHCKCDVGWEGDSCQYRVECLRDADCGSAGRCVFQSGQLVRKICACPYGYFGKRCDKRYKPKSNEDCFAYKARDKSKFPKYGMFDPDCYNVNHINANDSIYYRKIERDVEVVLDFASTSWVSLGWRPIDLSPTCRLFPDLEGVRRKKRAVSGEEAQSAAPPLVDGNEEEFFVAPPTRIEQEGPPPRMPDNNGLLTSALEAPMHPMDCVDVIMAALIDGRLHIRDMYSRDRSTPLDDFWYDGEDSLVAAAGVEIDGRTVVMFRRWSQEIEPTDHPLGPGPLHVIWAKGQTQGAYTHTAPSGLIGNSVNKTFYPDDSFKYHGNTNRGVAVIDFHTEVPKARTRNNQQTSTTTPRHDSILDAPATNKKETSSSETTSAEPVDPSEWLESNQAFQMEIENEPELGLTTKPKEPVPKLEPQPEPTTTTKPKTPTPARKQSIDRNELEPRPEPAPQSEPKGIVHQQRRTANLDSSEETSGSPRILQICLVTLPILLIY